MSILNTSTAPDEMPASQDRSSHNLSKTMKDSDPSEAMLSPEILAMQIHIRQKMDKRDTTNGKQVIDFAEAVEEPDRMRHIGLMRACSTADRAVRKLEEAIEACRPVGEETITITKQSSIGMESSNDPLGVDIGGLSLRILQQPKLAGLEYTEDEQRMLDELMKRKGK